VALGLLAGLGASFIASLLVASLFPSTAAGYSLDYYLLLYRNYIVNLVAAISGGLVSATFDTSPRHTRILAVIIGLAVPVFRWLPTMGTHVPAGLDLIAGLVGFAGVWASRTLLLRWMESGESPVPRVDLSLVITILCWGVIVFATVTSNTYAARTGLVSLAAASLMGRRANNRLATWLGAAPFLVSGVVFALQIGTLLVPRPRPTSDRAAVANLRTINSAEVTYLTSSGGRYGTIEELIAEGLLDSRFRALVSGYNFTLTVSENAYTVAAQSASSNGLYDYYSGADGVVRYSTDVQRSPRDQGGKPVR